MNWPLQKLGASATKIGSGATPRGGKSVYKPNGIPLIRSQNIYNGEFDPSGLVFLDEVQARALKSATVEPDDVLLNITGDSVARCTQVPFEHCPARVNQHVCIIRTNNEKLLPSFLKYWMIAPQTQDWLLMLASSGATRNALTKGMIESLDVPHPPLEVQHEISLTLESIDKQIELNRQTARTLEELAQRLFKSWFVDFDPVRAKMDGRQPAHMPPETAALFPDKLVDSPLGPIPEGWECAQLIDVAEHVRDSVKADGIEPDAVYVGLEHFAPKTLMLAQTGRGADVTSNKSRFQKGDLLFGKLRPYFHKVSVAPVGGICSTDILVLRPKSDECRAFCYLAFFQESVVNYATQWSTGTRMPRANWKTLSEFQVALPSAAVRLEFNNLVMPMIDRMFAMREESQTLSELRDRLLPKLISGEIRVAEVQEIVGESTA